MPENAGVYTLERLMRRNVNRLDFIRFVAALMVIYVHSFPLGQGENVLTPEPFQVLLNLDAGTIGVGIFFIISGFLVTASMERSRSTSTYLKARLLRIYPGLLGVVLLSMFLLGPLMTRLSLSSYFTHPDTWGYLRVLALVKTSYFLPGVFETNVFPYAVNGSLWTLFFETAFYLFVLGLFWIRGIKPGIVILMFAAIFSARFFLFRLYPLLGVQVGLFDSVRGLLGGFELYYGTRLLMYFLSGMVFYVLRDRIRLTLTGFLIAGASLLLFRALNGVEYWLALPGTYCLFYIAVVPGRLMQFSKYGDFSYGMYIYAFPVQQSLVYLSGGSMNPSLNFALASVVTLGFAVASWHLIEKRALELKHLQFSDLFRLRRAASATVANE